MPLQIKADTTLDIATLKSQWSSLKFCLFAKLPVEQAKCLMFGQEANGEQ